MPDLKMNLTPFPYPFSLAFPLPFSLVKMNLTTLFCLEVLAAAAKVIFLTRPLPHIAQITRDSTHLDLLQSRY